MRTLLTNAQVVNVFTDEILPRDILIEDGVIIGVDDYAEAQADIHEDLGGSIVCPGFFDAHIHIESTQMLPAALTRICLAHGTTSLISDPHEIANVCGLDGIELMHQASEGLPLDIYTTVPSCVPSSPFDEAGATLKASDIEPLYNDPRVLGLAELMDYPGVLAEDPDVMEKIADAHAHGLPVNGHAPLLSGVDLDKYIASGISNDHECSQIDEAIERIQKGQLLMIREGTAARNLEALLPLFDEPYNRHCTLVSDDRNATTLLEKGHIDDIIRQAVQAGKSAVVAVRMATIQAARYFGLVNKGAIAPGYQADLLVLNDLDSVDVRDVYKDGVKVVDQGRVADFANPPIDADLLDRARNSMHVAAVTPEDFTIAEQGLLNVIGIEPGQLLTELLQMDVQGVNAEQDIAKVAVIERHRNTGQMACAYIHGMEIKRGAIASSVSHDSHNLIVAGVDDVSMATAANHLIEIGGGLCVACGNEVIESMPLPIAGLMSDKEAEEVAAESTAVLNATRELGIPQSQTPFMTLAFISLPVIPFLKITARGLVDVANQKRIPLKASN